jgi:hypothetical protein
MNNDTALSLPKLSPAPPARANRFRWLTPGLSLARSRTGIFLAPCGSSVPALAGGVCAAQLQDNRAPVRVAPGAINRTPQGRAL